MAKNLSTLAVTFNWSDPAKKDPNTGKVAHHDIFHISSMLLIQDEKRGVLPGYFTKYKTDHPGATVPRKKGDGVFHDLEGTELTDVIYYYPIYKMPVPAKQQEEQPDKEQQ